MTIRFKVDADQAEVKDFRTAAASLNKFAAEVLKQQTRWAAYGAAVDAAKVAVEDIAQLLEAQNAHLDGTTRHHGLFTSAAALTGRIFEGLARNSKVLAANLLRSSLSFLSIASVTGGIAGLLGLGGGLLGLDDAARNIAARRRSVMGLGTSYGALASLGVNFSRFLDADALAGSVSGGVYDYESAAYTSLAVAGVRGRGDTTAQVVELLRRLPDMMSGVPDNQIGARAEALGLTNLLSTREIVAYLHATPKERADQLEHYKRDSGSLNLSPETLQKWSRFVSALDRAGASVGVLFASKLVSLSEPLQKFSESAVRLVAGLADLPLIQDGLTRLVSGLEWLSSAVGSETAHWAMARFLEGLDRLLPIVKRALEIVGSGIRGGWYAGRLMLDPRYNPPSWSSFGADVLGHGSSEAAHTPITSGGSHRRPSIRYHTRTGPHGGPTDKLGSGMTPGAEGSTTPSYPHWWMVPGAQHMIPAGTEVPPEAAEYWRTHPAGGASSGSSSGGGASVADPNTSGMTTNYAGVNWVGDAVSGGSASTGIVDLGRWISTQYPQGEFHALNDTYHQNRNPNDPHSRGLAFDYSIYGGDYDAARARVEAYLAGLGLVAGKFSGGGDYWIEPGTYNHIHVQFNSQTAADRYSAYAHSQPWYSKFKGADPALEPKSVPIDAGKSSGEIPLDPAIKSLSQPTTPRETYSLVKVPKSLIVRSDSTDHVVTYAGRIAYG